MSFSDDILVIQSTYDEFVRENQTTQVALLDYDRQIMAIRDETINQEIRNKVNEVFASMRSACDKIIQMEGLLKKNKLDAAMKSAKPSYNADNLLVELKDNYLKFSDLIKQYCVKGVNSESSIVKGLAKCFVNVKDMQANVEQYLEKIVKESKVKQKALKDITAKLDDYSKQRQKISDEIKEKALDLIDELKEKLNLHNSRIEEETVFSQESRVNDSFDSAEFILGRAEMEGKTVDFPDLSQNITLPNTSIEKIDLNVKSNLANVIIRYSEQDEDSQELYKTIESILVRFVQCYPAYFKRICALHQRLGSKMISILGKISPKPNTKLLFSGAHPGVETSQDSIKYAVASLGKILEERMSILASGYDNIINYNSANSDNAEPLILVVFKGYPNGISEQTKKDLIDIMREGNIHGLYLLLLCNEKVDDELTRLCSNEYVFSNEQLHAKDRTITATLGNENLESIDYFEKLHEKLNDINND